MKEWVKLSLLVIFAGEMKAMPHDVEVNFLVFVLVFV
jgi:hypothetical protein